MRIDVPLNDVWLALCDQYRAELPFKEDKGYHAQVYLGYQHALSEIALGLGKLFSHKKTIAIVEPTEPAFEALAVAFSEEGYTVKTIKEADLEKPEAWIDPIANELLFVLFPEDDPVTGRNYSYPTLHAALKEKRIFRLSVSHAKFKFAFLEKPAPYVVRVLSLASDRALALAGERFRVTPASANILPWAPDESEKVATRLKSYGPTEIPDWKNKIEQFERSLPQGFKAYFTAEDSRLFDRAVIYHEEFDGSAIIDELSSRLSIGKGAPGSEALLEATSPCRWENPRFAEWLMKRGETEEKIRGLIIISAVLLATHPSFNAELSAATEAIRKLQSGE